MNDKLTNKSNVLDYWMINNQLKPLFGNMDLLCVYTQDLSQYQKVQLFKIVLALRCRGTTAGILPMSLTFASLISEPFPVFHILCSVSQSIPFPWILGRLGQQETHSEDWREERGRSLGISPFFRLHLCNNSNSTTEANFLKS